MLVLSGIAAASASAALPEFSKTNVKFELGPATSMWEPTQDYGKWECTSSKWAEGTITGPSEVSKVTLTFTGCREFSGRGPICYNGSGEGELKTNELKGHLGYTNEAKHEVGLILEPASKGGLIAECELHYGYRWPAKIEGSIIAQITPVNTLVHERERFHLSYEKNNGEQKLTKFEGESIKHIFRLSTDTKEQFDELPLGFEAAMYLEPVGSSFEIKA